MCSSPECECVSHVCLCTFSQHNFFLPTALGWICEPLSVRLQNISYYRNPLSWSFLNPGCTRALTLGSRFPNMPQRQHNLSPHRRREKHKMTSQSKEVSHTRTHFKIFCPALRRSREDFNLSTFRVWITVTTQTSALRSEPVRALNVFLPLSVLCLCFYTDCLSPLCSDSCFLLFPLSHTQKKEDTQLRWKRQPILGLACN